MQKELPNKLKWVEQTSKLMDAQFTLPGTNFKFGIDPLLNLIPIAGDLSGFAVSAVLVLTMARNGASGKVIILMMFNILLDATIGAVPVLGWAFDFVYKANEKNIRLLKEHYEEGKHGGSGKGLIITIIVVFLILVIALIYGLAKFFGWVWGEIVN